MAFNRRYYAGGGTTTTLGGSMGSTDTSFTISSATGWPGASPAADFLVVIDRGTTSEEKILCSGNSGTTVTVAASGRGSDGTSATTHNSGATVSLCGGAIDFDETNQVSHLLGNLGVGSLILGAGAGVLSTELVAGSSNEELAIVSGSPAWVPSATSVMTTTGDLIYASAAHTLQRLAIGSAGEALVVSGGVPSWGSSGAPLAYVSYGPSSPKSYGVAAGTRTALDTTNLTVPFTVPANGKIRVRVTACGEINGGAANEFIIMSLLNHSGGARVGPDEQVLNLQAAASGYAMVQRFVYEATITGLTPGALQLDLAAKSNSGNADVLADDGLTGSNSYGPCEITVYAG